MDALCGDFSSMRETWKEEIKNSILEMQERQEEEHQHGGMEEERCFCLLKRVWSVNKQRRQEGCSAVHFVSPRSSLRASGRPRQRRRIRQSGQLQCQQEHTLESEKG